MSAAPRRRTPHLLLLAAITAAGALVRFSTLDVQSLWFDEAVTVWLVRMRFGEMLEQIPVSEATPPLYYVLAWCWTQVFGAGEVGIRSLSALFGTAAIPVAYATAAELVTRRVGLVAAALVATNPLLFWYAQEARAYALSALLTAAGFLFFVRLLHGRRGAVALWAGASALALATAYFSVFVVLPQAVWLLVARATRRWPVVVSVGVVGVVGATLVPLGIHQRCHASTIGELSLAARIVRLPKQLLLGFNVQGSAEVFLSAGALLVAATALLLLLKAEEHERRGAVGAGALGALALVTALGAALLGSDAFLTRSLLPLVVLFTVMISAGLGARSSGRTGLALAGLLCGLWSAALLLMLTDGRFQRENWRGLATALRGGSLPSALVVTPGDGPTPLWPYLSGVRKLPPRGAAVREIDLIALPVHLDVNAPTPFRRSDPAPSIEGFREVARQHTDTFTLIRYRSASPVVVRPPRLRAVRLDQTQPGSALLRRSDDRASQSIDMSCEGWSS